MAESDKVITEGFPEGWYVQDRPSENTALLSIHVEFPIAGGRCICLRPRAISTEEWLPTARRIARGLTHQSD